MMTKADISAKIQILLVLKGAPRPEHRADGSPRSARLATLSGSVATWRRVLDLIRMGKINSDPRLDIRSH
jgi:hypothetical protein